VKIRQQRPSAVKLRCSSGLKAMISAFPMLLTSCIAELQRLPRFLPLLDDSAAAKPVTPIAHFALDFACKESVCGDHGH
jgi:hypothetical protein